jgi:hypothetical protein
MPNFIEIGRKIRKSQSFLYTLKLSMPWPLQLSQNSELLSGITRWFVYRIKPKLEIIVEGKSINSFTPIIKLRLSLGRFSWDSRLFCGVARIFWPPCKVYWSALSFLHMRYVINLYKIALNKLAFLNKGVTFFFSFLSSRQYALTSPKDWCKKIIVALGSRAPCIWGTRCVSYPDSVEATLMHFSTSVYYPYTKCRGHSTKGLVADTKSRTDRLSTKRLTLLCKWRLKHELCASGGLQ